jgi:dTMP kinase
MSARFITFEGTEGGGKSTQIQLLADRLRSEQEDVLQIREPGGTAIGEEIRHLLKHSESNRNMTSEAELLLMCASRAQLVREVIRPALDSGKVVLCDRFYDSSVAYQGYGRELDLTQVRTIIDFAVGETVPDLTLFLHVPVEVSEARRAAREAESAQLRDHFEEADRAFFERVEEGFQAIGQAEPERVKVIKATGSIAEVQERIWACVIGRRNPVS